MPPKTRAVMDTNAAARDAVRQESLTAIAAKASIGIIGGDREGQGGAPAGQSPTTHISVVGAAPLAELPLEPQVVERVLPKFSMSPADFDLLDRARRTDEVQVQVIAVRLDFVDRVAQGLIGVSHARIDDGVDRAVQRRVLRLGAGVHREPTDGHGHDERHADEQQRQACRDPHWSST